MAKRPDSRTEARICDAREAEGPDERRPGRGPCWSGHRFWVGAPAMPTRSRCAAGAARSRSSPSRRWSRTIRCSAPSACRSGSSGAWYEVEVRSLETFDYLRPASITGSNRLGTCKHIEGVLAALRQRGARKFRAAAAEGLLRARCFSIVEANLRRPWHGGRRGKEGDTARRFLAPFLSADGTLARDADTIRALFSAWHAAPAAVRRPRPPSRHFAPWLERCGGFGSGPRRVPHSSLM